MTATQTSISDNNNTNNTPGTAQTRMMAARRVLLIILVANLGVALAKIALGLFSGALSVLADGFLSILDAASNVVGIAAMTIAARPPDSDHPYGHRRFETAATLWIGTLLLISAWELGRSALGRLFGGEPHSVEVSTVSFAVMGGTFVINALIVWYEQKRGHALDAPLLKADAEHTKTDLFVTGAVLIGLAGTALGLLWADAVVTLVVVGLIVRTGVEILRTSLAVLVDRAPLDTVQVGRLTQAVQSVPGVDKITRIRSRGPSDMIYADVDVAIPPATTTEHAAVIASEIEQRIKLAVAGVEEVQVHFAPENHNPPTLMQIVNAAAMATGLPVHEVTLIPAGNGRILEMHVEVDPRLTLEQAHDSVTALENRVRAELPDVTSIVTHIEPAADQSGAILQTSAAIALRDSALQIAYDVMPDGQWHDGAIRVMMGGYAVSMHCALPGSVSVQEAHRIAEDVETRIRAALPTIQRVTIHTEPPEGT